MMDCAMKSVSRLYILTPDSNWRRIEFGHSIKYHVMMGAKNKKVMAMRQNNKKNNDNDDVMT